MWQPVTIETTCDKFLSHLTRCLVRTRNLYITFYCDDKLYKINKPYIQVPMLVPQLNYTFETLVECISDMGGAEQITVFVSRKERIQPILTALINMPVAEMV